MTVTVKDVQEVPITEAQVNQALDARTARMEEEEGQYINVS